MPSTFSRIECHIVFSTKGRLPLLEAALLPRLHAFVAGAVSSLGGIPRAVGGVSDHLHLLAGLKPVHSVAGMVREVKKASHRFLREELEITDFAWQEGYAAFSVSPSTSNAVVSYIENQQRHHARMSFQEEVAELLAMAGLDAGEASLQDRW